MLLSVKTCFYNYEMFYVNDSVIKSKNSMNKYIEAKRKEVKSD